MFDNIIRWVYRKKAEREAKASRLLAITAREMAKLYDRQPSAHEMTQASRVYAFLMIQGTHHYVDSCEGHCSETEASRAGHSYARRVLHGDLIAHKAKLTQGVAGR